MSTKVYVAWRFRFRDFSRGVEFLRSKIWKNVEALALTCTYPEPVEGARAFISTFGDAGLNIFVDPDRGHAKYVYVIAYGLPGFTQKVFRLPPWIQNYQYWNNTDLPDRMTEKEWKARGKTWDRVALDDDRWRTNRMAMEILSNSPHCQVAIMKILQKRRV